MAPPNWPKELMKSELEIVTFAFLKYIAPPESLMDLSLMKVESMMSILELSLAAIAPP